MIYDSENLQSIFFFFFVDLLIVFECGLLLVFGLTKKLYGFLRSRRKDNDVESDREWFHCGLLMG